MDDNVGRQAMNTMILWLYEPTPKAPLLRVTFLSESSYNTKNTLPGSWNQEILVCIFNAKDRGRSIGE